MAGTCSSSAQCGSSSAFWSARRLRDAFVWLGDPTLPGGAERLYVTKSWRLTGGLRFAISERVVAKIEYLHNGEYGGVPPISNDVLTSSVVMSY